MLKHILEKTKSANPSHNPLHSELKELSAELKRQTRCFDPERYVFYKGLLLNRYLQQNGLKGCVLGVSGGIDSAVVLAILSAAMKQKNSPLKQIIPVTIPLNVTAGATNQDIALRRGLAVIEALGLENITVDMSECFQCTNKTISTALQKTPNSWANGQLVSYIRIPALYYIASIYSQESIPSVVVGTTNRDEGAYIGFFGKASDGMNDIQLISDLHKSEVYKVASLFPIPDEIIQAIPTGDTFDGQVDTQMIGASYDFVELYLMYLSLPPNLQKIKIAKLSTPAKQEFEFYSEKIEHLHTTNLHKYLGGSPAVHFDVYKRDIPGGWQVARENNVATLDFRNFVGYQDLDRSTIQPITEQQRQIQVIEDTMAGDKNKNFGWLHLRGLLASKECDAILKDLDRNPWVGVGNTGKLSETKKNKPVGSFRATAYNQEIADFIWYWIKPYIQNFRFNEKDQHLDWEDNVLWKAVGVSPVLRFISYESGGELVGHYDAPFNYSDRKKTQMSLILYLTDANEMTTGRTRFINDPNWKKPFKEWDHSDDKNVADGKDIRASIEAKSGDLVIFDHRTKHDGEPFNGKKRKAILRTDIFFEKVFISG